MRGPSPINFPLGSFPGSVTQESAGRLINCCSEPLGPNGPSAATYHRQPGLSQFAVTPLAGYRGGLIVNNKSHEVWADQATTVDASGAVNQQGVMPGNKHISIARNQNVPPDVVAVDIDNGAWILDTAQIAPATALATIGGTNFVAGDQVSVTFSNPSCVGFPVTITYTLGGSETAASVALAIGNMINADPKLAANNLVAGAAGGVIEFSQQGSIGNATTLTSLVVPVGAATNLVASVTGTGNETVTLALGAGFISATVGGTAFHPGDTVSLTFSNPSNPAWPVKVTYTLPTTPAQNATTVAAGLVTAIYGNALLAAASVSATSTGAVVSIFQPVGDETVTFSTTSLTGGAGAVGIAFSGSPAPYTGGGSLPVPNSVCFQDGYLFFTVADGRIFATGINSLSMNALTFITAQSRSDVTLLRGIAFSGLLFLFTTGHCEVWQDVANVAPAFPYARQVVLPYGLLQANAIAGQETGFDNLSWVAHDFGVWNLPYGQLNPTKISPPDLDRLIEAQHRQGNTLEASVYIFGGKKFWSLQSPAWTWEFNLSTQQWNERWSLDLINGTQSRWRGTGGHPAFGKWLLGDIYSGTLCFIDDKNYTELGFPMLMRLESAPETAFPFRIRIARADFNFYTGAGMEVSNIVMTVTGAASGTGGQIVLAVDATQQVNQNDVVNVAGVGGTTEANGSWLVTVIDATHILLQGSVFAHAWTSGGLATDVTAPPSVQNPTVAISWSNDGGWTWKNPLLRQLGRQATGKNIRVSVKRLGMTGPMGRRWRIDMTDPVNAPFLSAAVIDNPANP
jgi:hypothetical protein